MTDKDISSIHEVNHQTYFKALQFLRVIKAHGNESAYRLLSGMIKRYESSLGRTCRPTGNYK